MTKSSINNKGYIKCLKLERELSVKLDYDKFNTDNTWDGLNGYISNSTLKAKEIVENDKNLWKIKKAFRMSETDLRV